MVCIAFNGWIEETNKDEKRRGYGHEKVLTQIKVDFYDAG
jgi:hypothetical protein